MLVFDIETNGLLPDVSKVHCINIIDTETGDEYRYTDHENYLTTAGADSGVHTLRSGDIAEGLGVLEQSPHLAGHNIIGYDIPVLQHIYGYDPRPDQTIRDTQVMAAVMFPDIKERDWSARRKGRLDEEFEQAGLIGSHSLKAWAVRSGGRLKADFNPKDCGHTWETIPFTQSMDEYCMDDVRANADLYRYLMEKEWSEECFDLEMKVKEIVSRQERYGWKFDVESAESLAATLQKRHLELERECREVFQPWIAKDGKQKVPKRTMKRWVAHPLGSSERKGESGYFSHTVKDGAHTPVKLQLFNPGSRPQIADRLQKLYGWEPREYTQSGQVKVDESILSSLPYPEAQKIAEYMMVEKRLGQLLNGRNAWLKLVRDDGRIHGRVNTNGAVTGRMTHNNPNCAQVPRIGSPYGHECRALFTVEEGNKLVGCDADGLELCMLAHYMARYDNGDYVKIILEGDKRNGTDVHSLNQQAIKLNSRDSAKTWIYAFLYGAGNFTLGTTVLADMTSEKREKFFAKYPEGDRREKAVANLGATSRKRIAESFPALDRLIKDVKKAAERGYIVGLDGRKVYVRSAHAALNTLLQSAGAIVMKKALVLMDAEMQKELTHGVHYEFVGNVHDEVQIEVVEAHAEEVGRFAAASISAAGQSFNLRCPLSGSYDCGDSWAETH